MKFKDIKDKTGKVARVGQVTVELTPLGYFRLRFNVEGRAINLHCPGRKSEIAFTVALERASMINTDICTGNFDLSLEKYRIRQKPIPKKPKQLSLRDIWEQFKRVNPNQTERSTQARDWVTIDRLFSQLDPKYFLVENARFFASECLRIYSQGTLDKALACVKAAINWAIKTELIDKDYWKIKRSPIKAKPPKIFEDYELEAIYSAFKSSPKHNHYASYVLFCMLTGCRPQDATALTWSQIDLIGNRITIDRAFASQIREVKGTKDGKVRVLKLSSQLKQLIEQLPKIPNEHNLVFPSSEGSYIDKDNFNSRHWKPVITQLMTEGKIKDEYRPFYSVRHSAITRLIRQGIDIKTVARMVGNSPEIIYKHYLAFDETAEFTDIDGINFDSSKPIDTS